MIQSSDEQETMSKKSDETVDGCCDMRLGALASSIALSLVPRREKKEKNKNRATFQDLYKQLKEGCKYIFDKQNKRFSTYESILPINIKMIAGMVGMPNTTRVARALLLIQDAIRSMFGLRYYATSCKDYEAKCLNCR